jgi:hypothetical protein
MTTPAKQKTAPKQADAFDWTSVEAFDQILKEMQEVAGQPGRRIEVRGKGAHTTFTVKCATYSGDPINKAHQCPPDCPDKAAE